MMSMIGARSESTHLVASAYVLWVLWKNFLESYFKIPSHFSITKYHAFIFHSSSPGKVFSRAFSFSAEEMTFYILQNGLALDAIRKEADVIFRYVQYKPGITPLTTIKSMQQENWHGYLVNNILRCYYSNHPEMSMEFFEHRIGII